MPISFLNTYGPLMILVGTVLYMTFIQKYRAIAILLFAASLTTLVVVFIKELYLVPRPFRLEGSFPKAGLHYYSSFPSSHAALSFCIAVVGYLYYKHLGIVLFALAILISLGRVWANVHTPLDVVMGALVGLIVGSVVKGLTDST